MADRHIGHHEGAERGPLLVCIGAMHGNEPAGVRAIELVLKMLDVEPIRNPGFLYKGRVVGLIGNLQAYGLGKRYMERDLNRSFVADHIRQLRSQPGPAQHSEDRELMDLLAHVEQEIADYDPDKIILLDLHTTSSHGGIFTICRDLPADLELATALHAPIVLGMLGGLEGTTLHYFTEENMCRDIIPITFESGQHEERLAVNRAVAGILSCMKSIGSVAPDDVENHHEKLLIQYAAPLPEVTELLHIHSLEAEDGFRMKPGYQNFQALRAGEVVASDEEGPISVAQDCRILMPLYQAQGEDGFFLIKDTIR